MLKIFLISLFLLLEIFSFSSSSPEDLEIEQLKAQMKALQNRIKILEKSREEKRKNKFPPKVGLVLSGGGAKGLAHIGVLKVLEENNVKIDYITGTSMGAIVASLYSVGYTPEQIEKVLSNLEEDFSNSGDPSRENIALEKRVKNREYSISVRYDQEFNFFLPRGIRNNQKSYLTLKDLLWRAEGIEDFDRLPIPLRVIATDLDTGKAVAFRSGDLAQAVTASMAIPTIFDPVKIGDKNYVDGLIARNFPVEDIIEMGADYIIGVDVGGDVKPKDNYNFISVLDQLISYQTASSTPEQREMATLLITPDVADFKSTDFSSPSEIVLAGEKAASMQLSKLSSLPKGERTKLRSRSQDEIEIDRIEITSLKDGSRKEVIYDIFSEALKKPVNKKTLEKLVSKAYGFDFVNKIYYKVENNTLVLQVEENPVNVVGLAVNYQSNYGTTFVLGTDISFIGKKGILTTAEAKFGDYYGAALNNFFYYGVSNRIGAIFNLEYDESPFFLYSNGKKISDFVDKSYRVTAGILTQYENQLLALYGVTYNYSDFKQTVGLHETSSLGYNKNFADAFLKLTWDKTDKGLYPSKGARVDLTYLWGGGVSGKSRTFYGPLYNFEGYIPVIGNLSFNLSIFGGAVNGRDIPINRYIKLGGTVKNLDKGLLPFYGYHFQEKLLENLLGASLGIQYELFPNVYLTGKYNTATFSEPSFNIEKNTSDLWKNYSSGFGIGIAYSSIIGPVEFSASKSPENNSGVLQLSVGYFLD